MKILFAGPSLHQDWAFLRRHHADIAWHGPARRGDITRAVGCGATAIGLVDGLFDEEARLWQPEILSALSLGIAIAGGAGMGALRAAECGAFGMIGIGEIHRRCACGEVTEDADVAQLHAPEEFNYLPLTESWVNVEPTLRRMQAQRVLPGAAIGALLKAGRSVHYRERTYLEIIRRVGTLSDAETATVRRWLRDHAVDQKRLDALAVLQWLRGQPVARRVDSTVRKRPTAMMRVKLLRSFNAPRRT
jgi:hypothetical protein